MAWHCILKNSFLSFACGSYEFKSICETTSKSVDAHLCVEIRYRHIRYLLSGCFFFFLIPLHRLLFPVFPIWNCSHSLVTITSIFNWPSIDYCDTWSDTSGFAMRMIYAMKYTIKRSISVTVKVSSWTFFEFRMGFFFQIAFRISN